MKIKDKLNAKYTLIAGYVIVTAVIIYCLGLVANNIPTVLMVIGKRLSWLLSVLQPVVLAFAFAYLLTPVVDFFERWLERIAVRRQPKWTLRRWGRAGSKRADAGEPSDGGNASRIKTAGKRVAKEKPNSKKSHRGLAVLLTLALMFLVLGAALSLLVSSITNQFRLASIDDMIVLVNGYAATLTDFYNMALLKLQDLNIESETLQQYLQSAGTYLVQVLQNFGVGLVSSITNLSGFFTTILFTFIIGIYFLLDGQMLMQYGNRVMRAFGSEKWNRRFHQFVKDADTVFSGYVRGQLMDAFIMMILISVVLSIVGVKFAVVIGIFAGIGNLIPYVGPFVAYISTILVCLVNGDWKRLILAVVLLFIIQTVDGNLIGPRLLSSSINIHPLLVVISLIFGSAIGGLLGMLLAVPTGALVKVLFNRMIDYRLEKRGMLKQEEGEQEAGQE